MKVCECDRAALAGEDFKQTLTAYGVHRYGTKPHEGVFSERRCVKCNRITEYERDLSYQTKSLASHIDTRPIYGNVVDADFECNEPHEEAFDRETFFHDNG